VKELIVFLGPSLPHREAQKIVKADFRRPARQGDVFRALVDRPKAIALIDGVFEEAPSVWHHELMAALAAGVTVFGASSMGALRAVELASHGMIGIGKIFQGYLSRELADDADVALLHADGAHGYRPLSLPLVNVLATLEKAQRERVLKRPQTASVIRSARQLFFQNRTWGAVLDGAHPAASAKLRPWLEAGNEVDQKALDARECLAAAQAFVARKAVAPTPRPFVGSSFVRRRRLLDAHAPLLERLGARPDARALETAGLRRLLLAAFAKAGGLEVTASERKTAMRSVPGRGLAADQHEFIAEIVALEAKVLSWPERFVADGPSRLEGLALEAVLRGLWRQ